MSHMQNLNEQYVPLPFQPESLPEARNRYPEAIEEMYNMSALRTANTSPPAAQRKHVFDFKMGLRIIISVGFSPLNIGDERGPFEHVASIFRIDKVKSWNSKLTPIEEFLRTYYYISRWTDDRKDPVHQTITQEGFLHLIFPRPERKEEMEQIILRDYPTI